MVHHNISCFFVDDRTVMCNGSEYVTEKLYSYTETLFWINLLVYMGALVFFFGQ